MTHYPASILNLIKHISKLPGIGEKTAERLALHILRSPRKDAHQLAQSIVEVKDKVRSCSKCYGLSDSDLCKICSDPTRDRSLVCVVEQPADMVAVEKSGAFRGLYHILSGVLSPMDGIGPDDIRIRELITKVEDHQVKEVVLATGTNVEGESTAVFIAQRLQKYPVKVTRIASGVPIGGDLKYVDQVTLKKAMETRHDV
ncbi:MAG: recombination protein RecR [Desulfobacterales bacterium]|nr:MAG: recombination protein RecR [Desulfobacterales bacterium]